MKTRILAIAILVIALLVVISLVVVSLIPRTSLRQDENVQEKESKNIQEKIEKIEDGTEILYWYKENKLECCPVIRYKIEENIYDCPLFPEGRQALDWIKNNTEKNAVFLSWYTYGGMIEGYSQRKAIARIYSIELASIIEEEIVLKNILERAKTLPPDYFESNETIRDVIQAFTTTNINVTKEIMRKYGASYVFVMKQYNASLYLYGNPGYMPGFRWDLNDIFKIAKLYFNEELVEEKTVIVRLIENRETGELELIYSDSYVNIYRLKI